MQSEDLKFSTHTTKIHYHSYYLFSCSKCNILNSDFHTVSIIESVDFSDNGILIVNIIVVYSLHVSCDIKIYTKYIFTHAICYIKYVCYYCSIYVQRFKFQCYS